ncbi:high-affinity iron permease [Rhodotorula toruloides]
MGNVFSVPIFIITLRETIEAAIIVSVLLSLVESLVHEHGHEKGVDVVETLEAGEQRRLIRRMRLQIWAGALVGLFIALCIGTAFIAFFTALNDLWGKTEEIWEGVFSLIACIIIFVMGVTMLRIDRSKLKWKAKLSGAFHDKVDAATLTSKDRRQARNSKWTLFVLPLVTVLREGLEAVVFVGGVSLGQSAKSIPLAAIVGIFTGLIIGYLIYASGSRINLSIFLVISTNILFLLGAGLFSKAVGDFQTYRYNNGVGGDVGETGSGPGSFDPTDGSVWHLTYGNPGNNTSTDGYSIFNAILGWTNNATIGTILSYVFYWFAAIACLVYMKWSEGRTTIFGLKSAAWNRRAARREVEETRRDSPDVKEKKDSVETPVEEDRRFASHV